MFPARIACASRAPQHKVLRAGRKLLNMSDVRRRGVRLFGCKKESLSHADDSQEESEEDDIEGRREAEGRDEEKEEVGEPLTSADCKGRGRQGDHPSPTHRRAAGSFRAAASAEMIGLQSL